MKVKDPTSDPVALQLLKLSARERKAVIAACDGELRYTHLFNPHPQFSPDESLGKRDDELAPPEDVAELVALKEEVLKTMSELRRRVHLRVGEERRVYSVLAEPILDASGAVSGVATAAVDLTPTLDVQALLGRVAERLEAESHRIAERWHEELGYLLNVRPQRVFPGDELLDGAPRIVEWLADSVLNGQELDRENTESLRAIASHWRRGGYSVEESLIHVRALTDMLMDAVASAASDLGEGVSPEAGVEAARRIGRSMDALTMVLVATYRDAEETRFSDFGTTLAHEIRGNLGAALSAIQVARLLEEEEETAEKRARVLERAEHALEQANGVVASVRSLSQAADGTEQWDREPLNQVIADVVTERHQEPAVEVRVAEDLPDVRVPVEPVHLILHNLVENAIRYSNPEQPQRWVKLHTEWGEDGHLVVHVGDNGLGIPEDEQERIFHRFHRGQAARGEGFGLGLAIVRETAGKIGGRILLESAPGEGSTFSLTIPANQLED